MKRVVLLVADGVGVGELPDARAYGDEGANTIAHTAAAARSISLPNLQKLGFGNLGAFPGVSPNLEPIGWCGRLAERSAGKDTTTGHWEIAGLVTEKPFALFPKGFPQDLLTAFINEAGLPGVLGNKAASGTVIIEELGEEHIRTGKPIVYTSGDSVFQVAAHEKHFGLERLYSICQIARRLTLPLHIGRVIARPFIGEYKTEFSRTTHRRDYALMPEKNVLDVLQENKVEVFSVGKIEDIFAHRGISHANHTGDNATSLEATLKYLKDARGRQALIFTNLVDFDMLYGHRRDAKGFAKCLEALDAFLPKIMSELGPDDWLLITGDHGCDPTYRGTDHTREYVPLVVYNPQRTRAQSLGDRSSFADIAASLLEGFKIQKSGLAGQSFLCSITK